MRHVYATALVGSVVGAILVQNLFGGVLNAFFLRYPGIDKILHFVEYFAVVVVLNAGTAAFVEDPGRRLRMMLGAGVILALTDESVQWLAPGRTVEGMDLVADLSGLTVGWLTIARPRRSVALAAGASALIAVGYVTWSTHRLLIDYSRALQYERQHDFVRAREHYHRAVAAGLQSPGLFNELAWVEVESGVGDPSVAVQYAERALRMQPDNPDILDTYGWALHRAGRSAEGLRPLQEAFRRKPDIFCIHYHLGAAYLALGAREPAERHFRRQLERTDTREAVFARRALAEMGLQR